MISQFRSVFVSIVQIWCQETLIGHYNIQTEFPFYAKHCYATGYAECKSVPKLMRVFNICKTVFVLVIRNVLINVEDVGCISHV